MKVSETLREALVAWTPRRRERAVRSLMAAALLFAGPVAWANPPSRRSPETLAPSKVARATERSEQTLSVCMTQGELVFSQTFENSFFSDLQQSVAPLAGGSFGTVWSERGIAGKGWVYRMQWVDRDGRTLFPAGGRLLATEPGYGHGRAVIAPDATAGAYVAIEMERDIVVQRFDETGEPQWPGAGIVAMDRSAAQAAAWNPYIISNPAGGAFVCFALSAIGPTNDIRCQRFDATGARLWSRTGASVGAGGNAEWLVLPRGVTDGAGGLLLFWRNQRDFWGAPDPGPMLMEGQRFGPEGHKLWGPVPKVVRTTRLPAINWYTYRIFQVVSDGSGGAVLGFDDWTGTDLALDVMAQRVSREGELLWGEGAVVTGANGVQAHDQTIATGDGGAFVAVYEWVSRSHNRLRLFRLGRDGVHEWSPTGLLVSDPGATALDYSVFGVFDGSQLRLAWTHQNSPATFEFDVVFSTYSPDGIRTRITPLTMAKDAQFIQGMAWSPEFGGILAVWSDRRKGTWSDVDVGGAYLREDACEPSQPKPEFFQESVRRKTGPSLASSGFLRRLKGK